MNAVEIEEAVSELAEKPFDAAEFPYQFLTAFGNKDTTIKRLRAGSTNASDLPNGVLQRNNIHIAIASSGTVAQTLGALRTSPATTKAKARFILATDGDGFEAEEIESGETVACTYADFPSHFGFFLALAGITTVKQIRESSFDIRATGRLNRLYVELLKDNPDWATAVRRPDMNHFLARLIFCFFAEDTDIFHGQGLFTATVQKMSAPDSSNTHEIIGEIFRAMNVPTKHEGQPDNRYRHAENIRNWANHFPYVNGGLFSDSAEVPRFSKIARSYLLHIGSLDWTKINPDIFGSMIQAVADDEERGALGMHYTSVPNILKVLNPLFLDDLRARLEEAGNNARVLLNLRRRMARIRIFDPACGSGNFLVIAYKEMRAIEAVINERRGEANQASEIPLTNFRGIELRDFPAEIARLALIIAEYQCDVTYRGQKLALLDFLPLDKENWITCGNALRLNWLTICPPTGTSVKHHADDLLHTPIDQPQIDFENEGGETYICGNPPYVGYNKQSAEQKSDITYIFDNRSNKFGNLDYVCCWFVKAASYNHVVGSSSAFVSTNSICQGSQVPVLWPILLNSNQEIFFARTSFKWKNLASDNAGVTVIVIGMRNKHDKGSDLYSEDETETSKKNCRFIGPYLIPESRIIVSPLSTPISNIPIMTLGNHPYFGSDLIIQKFEMEDLISKSSDAAKYIRPYVGAAEIIKGIPRYCLWISDDQAIAAATIPAFSKIFQSVQALRKSKKNDKTALALATSPYRFRDQVYAKKSMIAIPQVTSENRKYLPADLINGQWIISFQAYGIFDAPLWALSIIVSKLHLCWISTVCSKMETRYRYSNTLGWNTFPVPTLTEKNKADLTHCAEDILLAREAHFPATIADLYDPDDMPANLREAHERNDEVLERIYIGRRFRNDTERLEKLFDLYMKMTASAAPKHAAKAKKERSS